MSKTQHSGYLIGVDGGGTGTRVLIRGADGFEARAQGGPSGLGLGINNAWCAILDSIRAAFSQSGTSVPDWSSCRIGLGLAGVHNPAWAREFTESAPNFAAVRLETDGFTTLMGAHSGQPGAIIAVGTGVVGEAWFNNRSHKCVSGWGFPSGDEGSGAWLGLRAASLAQKALDGRVPHDALSQAVIAEMGGNIEAVFNWLGSASQTRFASLAPLVLQFADTDPAAAQLLTLAGIELAQIAQALDPEQQLPLALCGGLGRALDRWLPPDLQTRTRAPLGDSVDGAIFLVEGALSE
ncbi:ATPase [Burkholderiaceae bacterium DAT-1]|nr:ATPase [Burkholderiaceae bacterium DAT-1]